MNPPVPTPPSPDFGPGTDASRHDEIPLVPDYELLRWIGGGAYGDVWLARDMLGVHRAVKVVRPRISEAERAYRREFEGLQQFEPISREHDSQVDILHVGRIAAGGFFYVMELADDVVSGQRIDPASYQPRTLHSELRRRRRLPIQECVQIAIALTRALEHLHGHGLIHRDVKPGNIVYVNGMPKLADIGLVANTEVTASRAGTDGYLPDEGAGRPAADLYSLGKTLYEISTGRRVDDYPELPEDFEQMPEREGLLELNAVLTKACAYEPRERYQSAGEMRKELQLLQDGESVVQSRKRKRLLQVAAYAGTASLILGLAALGYVARVAQSQRRAAAMASLQMKRLSEHGAGWSSNVWALTREVATALPVEQARSQAAATLVGLDASEKWHTNDYGAGAVVFDRPGNRLLISSLTGGVRMLDIATEVVTTNGVPGLGLGAFRRDGTPLQLAPVPPLEAQLWDLAKLERLGMFVLAAEPVPGLLPEQAIPMAALTPGGDTLALGVNFGGVRGQVAVWRAAPPAKLAEFACTVTALALSPDGELVATGDNVGQITVRSLTGGALLAEYHVDHAPVRSLAFGRDPLIYREATNQTQAWLLASGSAGSTVAIYSSARKFARAVCPGSSWDVYAVSFSPDGTTLASGGRQGGNGSVRLWDVATGHLLLALSSGDFVTSVAFSPDGRRLATSSGPGFVNAGEVHVWSLEPGRGIQSLRGLSAANSHLCFSKDDRLVAALAQNWQVGVWDRQTGTNLCVLEVPTGTSADNAAMAFSPDARYFAFATGGEGGLWETATWRRVSVWPLQSGLADEFAYADTNRLWHFRCETLNEKAAPDSAYDRVKYPRVGRLRNLLATNFAQVVLQLTNVNRQVACSEMTSDGKYLVVEWRSKTGGKTENAYVAYELSTDRQLWQVTYPPSDGYRVRIEPTGQWVAIQTNADVLALVIDIASGSQVGTLPIVPFCSTAAFDMWVCDSPLPSFDRGFSLTSKRHGHQPLLCFGIDTLRGCSLAQFSHDGNLLAWGSVDGPIFIADLPEVRRRLAELGIGW